MKFAKQFLDSEAWIERAKRVIPGGVNSPVRSFQAIGGTPRFIARGAGSRLWDVEGREYIDYVCSWGAFILGHAHPQVVEAVKEAASNSLSFGAVTAKEVLLAEMIQSAIPSVERLRLVNSGTEATMTAVRLARAFSGRNKILKFQGCYHGHADSFLVKAGSGLLTSGNPSSAGLSPGVVQDTVVAQYNDPHAMEKVFSEIGNELACVIVEPVAANMGLVLPREDFLPRLAELCQKNGTVLIFDEVITGFRFHFGGYQTICGVAPDLTCLGKIIGGGLPLAAVGGKEKIMSLLAPEGPVYQAGTLSGNPVAVAAGFTTLQILKSENPYARLARSASLLAQEIRRIGQELETPITVNQAASLLTLFFSQEPVETYQAVVTSKSNLYSRFFLSMLEQGIYLPPSAFEAWFLSTAHAEEEIEKTVSAVKKSLQQVAVSLAR